MAIVFEKTEPKHLTLDKDGTIFHFEIIESKRQRARINMILDPEHDPATMFVNFFRTALVGWKNLKGADGKDIPFSIAVRDALVDMDPKIFTEADVMQVAMGPYDGEEDQWTKGPAGDTQKDTAKKNTPAARKTRKQPDRKSTPGNGLKNA